ncbi:MAG: indolepyruvate oxidoreductase subunit beta [Bacilli bacterium]|nr:indolepyruvate oxidoreductase subunit beta [Bacilli bacterium]
MNILIVGVGGQGTILASKILGAYATLTNQDCKLSEIHGMSQRGGNVVTHVKMASKVYSPIIGYEEADMILAFELLEAKRAISFLKKGKTLLANTQKIYPISVASGVALYPNVIKELENSDYKKYYLDALEIAKASGNIKTVNVVMLGAMSYLLDFDQEKFICALKETIPSKYIEENLKAYQAGINALKENKE